MEHQKHDTNNDQDIRTMMLSFTMHMHHGDPTCVCTYIHTIYQIETILTNDISIGILYPAAISLFNLIILYIYESTYSS